MKIRIEPEWFSDTTLNEGLNGVAKIGYKGMVRKSGDSWGNITSALISRGGTDVRLPTRPVCASTQSYYDQAQRLVKFECLNQLTL